MMQTRCPSDEADSSSMQAPLEATRPPARRGRRPRVVPAERLAAVANARTIFDRLELDGLLKKVTEIVLIKSRVPWYMRADAIQEIHAYWLSLKAKPEYATSQVAAYAYKAGQHVALRLRREIGAVCTIPGNLFRTGRHTAFAESIGAATNPTDIEDYLNSLVLSEAFIEDAEPDEPEVACDNAELEARLEVLDLNASQRRVARLVLGSGMSASDAAEVMNVKPAYVNRLLSQIMHACQAEKAAQSEPPALAPECPVPGDVACTRQVAASRASRGRRA